MNKDTFTFLRDYSFDPVKIDRLIISAFLISNGIKKTDNELLKSYFIVEKDLEYDDLLDFLKIQTIHEIEELIEIFEFVISPKEKVVTGSVYTPKIIREYIIDQCFSKISNFDDIRICDPACGCAGFLYTAAKIIRKKTGLPFATIFSKNIYGLDIQEYSVTRSKLLLTLMAISEEENCIDFKFNLFRGNALNFNWSDYIQNYNGFDFIIGNPPYVCSRNIDIESKKLLIDWKVCASGHPDLYIPFFQIGIENLKNNGILGFITMNTFFKSVNGRALRNYFGEEALAMKILDFGGTQVFQSKSTYTCICIIQNKKSNKIMYAKIDEDLFQNIVDFKPIYYNNLNHKNGWNLQESDILNKIERTGTPLGELYQTRNGIATLKNHIYIFDPYNEDDKYYYVQEDDLFAIEKEICKEIINPNKLIQIDNINFLRQKILFPYQYNEQGQAILLNEKELEYRFPFAYKYLKANKSILATRDKGKGNYENWYAYGRNQSLEKYTNKLFFPHITPHIPNYSLSTDENLLFYNGIAVISESELKLRFLMKIMSSRLFWFYITKSSKPYGSGYFSLSRNYIKNFGICEFSDEERLYILNECDEGILNNFLESKYKVHLPSF